MDTEIEKRILSKDSTEANTSRSNYETSKIQKKQLHDLSRNNERWLPSTSFTTILFKPTIGVLSVWIGLGVFNLLTICLLTVLVYKTGGTTYAYPYLILLPVLFSSAIFKIPGGLVAALFASMALGPLMPLDVISGTMQTTQNWLVRMTMYLIIGGFAGLLSTMLHAKQQQALAKERIDPVTGLISPIAAARAFQDIGAGSGEIFKPNYSLVISFEGLGTVLRTLGSGASNEAIYKIGSALNESIGDYALVTRIHGATFGILLLSPTLSTASALSLIKAEMPTTIQLANFSIIVSPRLGFSRLDDADRVSGQPFRKSLAALHLAREQRMRIARYNKRMDKEVNDNLRLIWEFGKALERNELTVKFQPQIELATGKLLGIEALVRWSSRQFGDVSPAHFVPIIESTTLIDPMTRFVVERSIKNLEMLHSKGMKVDLALNISPVLLQDISFLKFLKELPLKYNISPKFIEIEITETALTSDMALMRRELTDLRALGFSIAVDDFGTGYSSFKYLKDLTIQTVKLDQSFVMDLPYNKENSEIVSAIASMCMRMHYKLIAEGVETTAAMEFLSSFGCHAAQGYLYAKPMAVEDLLLWENGRDIIIPRSASL